MQETSLSSTWGRISDIKEERRRRINRSRNLEIVSVRLILFSSAVFDSEEIDHVVGGGEYA